MEETKTPMAEKVKHAVEAIELSGRSAAAAVVRELWVEFSGLMAEHEQLQALHAELAQAHLELQFEHAATAHDQAELSVAPQSPEVPNAAPSQES